jgi:hypothetical protein
MSKNISISLALMVAVLFINVAQASYIKENSFYCDWGQYNYDNSTLSLAECLTGLDPVTINCGGESLSSYRFRVIKVIQNETPYTWTGYILTLDPMGNAYFEQGTASCFGFDTVNYPDLTTIEFFDGTVPPNYVMSPQFYIQVPDPGSFSFTLTQQPIPEPATVALFGLGALVFLIRKRR